jgi:hypothetical protein
VLFYLFIAPTKVIDYFFYFYANFSSFFLLLILFRAFFSYFLVQNSQKKTNRRPFVVEQPKVGDLAREAAECILDEQDVPRLDVQVDHAVRVDVFQPLRAEKK